ncbi:MAG: indole-3-glycerol phosphate synthase TrpC [Chitinispirillaceae bacterium]|nr:indole-3-glycerol phosphate synthase TrpC [Chitinispirillaceae bacterium]
MNSFLEKIIEQKKREVILLKTKGYRCSLDKEPPPRRNFLKAIKDAKSVAIIAEVKKASPSKGIIRADFDPANIAMKYMEGGADCISVLTDELFFMGSLDHLTEVRKRVSLPVLRKDFIIDTIQIEESAFVGADALLLIAGILDAVQLRDFYSAASELNIQPLVEIHHIRELDKVMKIEPSLIGINNRDLNSFITDINVTLNIIKYIPQHIMVISESGFFTKEDIKRVYDAGVKAFLIGEAIMKQENPEEFRKEIKTL